MPVEMWFRDSLETEMIDGDIVTLTNNLNVAAANGKQFAILDTPTGPVMVETKNIIKARQSDGKESFIGRG